VPKRNNYRNATQRNIHVPVNMQNSAYVHSGYDSVRSRNRTAVAWYVRFYCGCVCM